MDLDLLVSNQGNTYIVRVSGEVDFYSAPALDLCLKNGISSGHSCLMIDLQGCTYFDSEGIKVLLRAYRSLGDSGQIAICGATGSVRRVFDLSGLRQVFRFAASVDEAACESAHPE